MQNYNFYNLILLSFNFNGHKQYKKYFDNEYLRITDKAGGKNLNKNIPKITVHIVDELPKKEKNDIEQIRSFKGLFTYKYLLKGLDTNEVYIYFRNHNVSHLYTNAVGVYLQAQVIEPVMYLKLLENNVLFMHAAGVAKDNKGYLMPAHGGTGKTTTSIALFSHGFKMLGDDLLLVDIDKHMVYPYPRPLHLFTYNINSLHGARVPFKYVSAIYFKNILRYFLERIMRTDFLISTRVHADEIFPKNVFARPVQYKSIKFLTKTGDAITEQKITTKNIDSIAKTIIKSADLNDSLYSIVGKAKSKNVEELELKQTSKLLSQFGNITFLNTRKLDLQNKKLVDKIFK